MDFKDAMNRTPLSAIESSLSLMRFPELTCGWWFVLILGPKGSRLMDAWVRVIFVALSFYKADLQSFQILTNINDLPTIGCASLWLQRVYILKRRPF